MTQQELQQMTITDLLQSEAYRQRMTQMLDAAWKVEKERRKKGISNGHSIIRKLHEQGIESGEQFADAFLAILNKESRLSAYMRREITNIGTSIARVILNELQERIKEEEGKTSVNSPKT